jgi:hypothetical protein
MKFTRWAIFFLAALALSAQTSEISGNWQVAFVRGVAYQTIGDATFEFKVNDDKLTGTANIGMRWPGRAPISDGKVDGDRISFTVVGRYSSSSGIPRMTFALARFTVIK